MRRAYKEGLLDCECSEAGSKCRRPATIVNHYAFDGDGSFTWGWSLCDEHVPVIQTDPEVPAGHYTFDVYVPLIRPGDCPAVDDCIVRWTTDLASWAPSREEAA